jgi:hypothetical protein
MKQKLNLIFALAAGLVGGALAPYLMNITSVHAAAQAPDEIRAQSFTLVDRNGAVLGTFSNDAEGKVLNGKEVTDPVIKLFDAAGREIWRAGGSSVTLLDTNPHAKAK